MYSLPTDDFRQYINGELVSGRGRTTQIRCPGNGEPVAQIALATKEQAQQALEAARDAFPGWSALTLEERGAWMMKLRDAIQRESENLLNLLMLESGKLRSHAAFETGSLTGYLSFFLEQAKSEHTQGIRDAAGGKNMFLAVREPDWPGISPCTTWPPSLVPFWRRDVPQSLSRPPRPLSPPSISVRSSTASGSLRGSSTL